MRLHSPEPAPVEIDTGPSVLLITFWRNSAAVIPKDNCSIAQDDLIIVDMAINGKAQLVAIIDDNELVRIALEGLMKSVGFPTLAFARAEEFLASDRKPDTACLIVDIRMPGMSGLELQAKLNAERYRIPTIFITAHGDEMVRMQALRAGAVEFFTKPFDDEALLQSVRAALEC